MRRFSMLLGVVAVLVSALAVSAGTASAALPEIGRCVKVEPVQEGKKKVYHGKYAGKKCTKLSATGRGKYEFLAGPGTKNHFYGVANEPEPVLETTTGSKISCGEAIFKGEYTGAKTEKVSIILAGCEEGLGTGIGCQSSPVTEGEIEGSEAFEGELGLIKGGAKPVVGWAIKHTGPMFTFTCGRVPSVEHPTFELKSVNVIEGGVIGTLTKGFFGTDINKMSLYSVIKYSGSKGVQSPEEFEGGIPETLTNTVTRGVTTTKEPTSLSTVEETKSGVTGEVAEPEAEEPLEVKTI